MSHTTQSSFEQDSCMSRVVVKAASLLFFIAVDAYSNGRVVHTVLLLLGGVDRPALNFFVASLSIADLASCLIVMPLVFVALLFGEWLFGSIFCSAHTMLSTYFANVSMSVLWCTNGTEPSIEDVSPVCQNDRPLHCFSSSGSCQLLLPRPCCGKNSTTLGTLDCVSSTPLNTGLFGHLSPTPLVAAYENHSRKRPAPVMDTFFASRGCPLTRASTV